MRCHIVDVFAESRFAGNQLAVVRDIGALDGAGMQAIAREMNFSETTFVVDEDPSGARVRIFTPELELPFAGHPTIGTAWVLRGDRRQVTLCLDVGSVSVEFDDGGLAWMTPPPVQLGEWIAPDRAAALLGLVPQDLDPGFPPRHAVVGPRFALIGVRGLDALKRARVDASVRDEMGAGDFLGTFVFAPEPYHEDADFSARMFFESVGPREDPATGSANAAFAAYLAQRGRTGSAIVEQGFEIARPSRLYLELDDPIRVGGRVQPVLEGAFDG